MPKKVPAEVLGHKNLSQWRAGMNSSNEADQNAELTELYGLFKKVAGKDKILTRAEFLKKFEKKIKLKEADGSEELIVIKDIEKLFNSSAIDYDYNTVSLHEFMMLMIVIRSKDITKKLQYAFAMHDTNGSGKLEKDEVEAMLEALTTHIANEKKREALKADLLKEIMTKRDLNKDGKISLEELQAMVADGRMLWEHLGKGVTSLAVADSMFAGQTKSSMCLVM